MNSCKRLLRTLAVLLARLKGELAAVADALVSGADLRASELTEKHADWAESFKGKYEITAQNALDIVRGDRLGVRKGAGARWGVHPRQRGQSCFLAVSGYSVMD